MVKRVRDCGVRIMGGAAVAKIKDGTAHFANLFTCGSIWLCPVCTAKIRTRRGEEIAEAAARHVAAGGYVYFLTATLPHEHGDTLEASLGVLTAAWREVTAARAYKRDRLRFGVLGMVKTVEITHGRNGWHPHMHALVFTKAELPLFPDEAEWVTTLDALWAAALRHQGWPEGKQMIRLRVDRVARSTTEAVAGYVAKLQEGGAISMEVARADLKGGRRKSRTPLEILRDFGDTGNAADMALWREYEQATIGKSALRWSPGLRALLLPDVAELTDEEIASEEIGGTEVAAFLPRLWRKLVRTPGAEAAVLDAIEAGGFDALVRLLVELRLGVDGLLTPDEWAAVDMEPTTAE